MSTRLKSVEECPASIYIGMYTCACHRPSPLCSLRIASSSIPTSTRPSSRSCTPTRRSSGSSRRAAHPAPPRSASPRSTLRSQSCSRTRKTCCQSLASSCLMPRRPSTLGSADMHAHEYVLYFLEYTPPPPPPPRIVPALMLYFSIVEPTPPIQPAAAPRAVHTHAYTVRMRVV